MSPIERNLTLLLAADNWSAIAERAAVVLPRSDDWLLALSAQTRAGTDEPFVREVVDRLERLGGRVEIIAAPRSRLSGRLGFTGRRWTSVDLRGRGDRLTHAKMPERLAGFLGLTLLVNDLTRFDPGNPAIAIGVWAQFAHPLQRFGASISQPGDGLTAEIALAAPPAWYLMAASWQGKPMAILADDMVAAELVGLAIGHAQADPDREFSGPWEHPLVQRATDLGLGVRVPSAINFVAEWLSPDHDLSRDFSEFGAGIAGRIGIVAEPN